MTFRYPLNKTKACAAIAWLCAALLPAAAAYADSKASPEVSTNQQAENIAQRYADEGMKLVWADEFDVDGRPNPEHWDYEHGFVRNRELQFYQPQNAKVQDGKLIIEARREQVKNPAYRPDSRNWRRSREFGQYTSALLHTRGNFEFLYGRLEVRAKIVTQPGLWPAIWTLGSARGWPGCGEIDVMEYYDDSLLANAAWYGGQGRGPQWDTEKIPMRRIGEDDWDQNFHTWRMDWDKDFIRIYLDDVLLNEIDLTETINNDEQQANPFREPHYILLNLAIGGMNGGDPSKTDFPNQFEVDYVRVYQQAKEGS